ncbi:MAG: cell division protein DivIVA [Ignavibacteriales bacterium CG_4_9_14_3_um_filter_34_10]|nr:MAG: cell division protein DivIVA [Ignavibacteriales bacterium CG_4_9_14_3_um_filter_34_10]
MKFTPYNIKNQEFNKSYRGFDKEEVTSFLESVSSEFAILISENDNLKKEIDSLRKEIEEYKKVERSLQSTLINAQESSTKALDSAKKQHQLIIREAEIKAAQLTEKAKEEVNAISNDIIKLKEEKKLIISKLRAILDSQSRVFEYNSGERTVTPAVEPETNNESKIDVDDILEKLL